MISVKSRKKVLSAKGLNYTMIAAYKKIKILTVTDWGIYSLLKQTAEAVLRGNTGNIQEMISAETDEFLRWLYGQPKTCRASHSSKRGGYAIVNHTRYFLPLSTRLNLIYRDAVEKMPQRANHIYYSWSQQVLLLCPSPTNNEIVSFVWWRNCQQSELWLTAHGLQHCFNHNALQQNCLVTLCRLKFWPWICGLCLVKYAGEATWSAGLQLQPDIVLIRTGEADTHTVLKGRVSSDRGGAIFHVFRLSPRRTRRSQFQSRPWFWLTNKNTPIFPFPHSQCMLCSGSARFQGPELLYAPIYSETHTRTAQRQAWWVTSPGSVIIICDAETAERIWRSSSGWKVVEECDRTRYLHSSSAMPI